MESCIEKERGTERNQEKGTTERRKNDMPHQRATGKDESQEEKGGRELERCDILTFRIFRSFFYFRKGHKKIFKLRNEFRKFVIYLILEYRICIYCKTLI